MKRIILSIAITLFTLSVRAQHEFTDTIHTALSSPATVLSTPTSTLNSPTTLYEYGERFDEYQDSVGRLTAPSIYFPAFYPGQSSLLQWGGGALVAAGRRETMPGLMGLESAVLNYYQRMGRFALTAYGSVTKIGYFRGLSTQWGYGGSLSYQVSDNLSLTAFGSYATKTRISNPAALGFVDYPSFGGYADIHFGSSRFGVKAGAQSYYALGSRHWQTQPIVMPYYRLAKGCNLGIDVGGILYNILLNKLDKSRSYNPANVAPRTTIAPPKMGPGRPAK
jgi:hypothetical protein